MKPETEIKHYCIMYRCTLEVRGYELDSFNHVNNAVYLNYFEHARWQMIRETGLINFFKDTGYFLVVVDIHIKYMKEITLFDELVIETSCSKKEPYLYFYQEMYKSGSRVKVSKAEVKTLLLDNERIPIDLPEDFEV
ncbi:MAG: acyl-CoA thioesterase [Bacteroidales bacterium]|nr:MAG: acyl-CoA thioesterase [Bacteroidales bacterium]